MAYHFYIQVTGESQGLFAAETPEKQKDSSLCRRFRHKGSVNNDPTRGGKGAARSNEPLVIEKPWGKASPQFAQAFWSNEVLKSVKLTFMHPDGNGKSEVPFLEIELTNATVASHELTAGEGSEGADGTPAEIETIAFRYEQLSIKNIPGQTAAKYDWKNQAA